MSTSTMQYAHIATTYPTDSASARWLSFFAQLMQAREEAARKHVARKLAGQSTERLKNGLGLSDEDMRALRAGEPRVPVR